MDELDIAIQRRNSVNAIDSCMLRLKWLAAATRFELAMLRHDRALKAGSIRNSRATKLGVGQILGQATAAFGRLAMVRPVVCR